MPTYVYQVIEDDGSEGETFEAFQKMSDEPLTQHPETGKPVRRVIQAPNISGQYSDAATKRMLSGFKKRCNDSSIRSTAPIRR